MRTARSVRAARRLAQQSYAPPAWQNWCQALGVLAEASDTDTVRSALVILHTLLPELQHELRSHALFSSFVQVAACKVSAAAATCLRRRHVGAGALLLLCLTPRVCVRLSLCAVRCVGMAGKVHA